MKTNEQIIEEVLDGYSEIGWRHREKTMLKQALSLKEQEVLKIIDWFECCAWDDTDSFETWMKEELKSKFKEGEGNVVSLLKEEIKTLEGK